MAPLAEALLEIVRTAHASVADTSVRFRDRATAEAFLQQFKRDPVLMGRFRGLLANAGFGLSRLGDDEVIRQLAARATSDATLATALAQDDSEHVMSGYFTMLKCVLYAQTLGQLEHLMGYRRG